MKLKLLTLFLITSNAWGYRLTQDFVNGFYWATLPVRLTVSDSNPSRQSLLSRLASSAISEWQTRTGLNLWQLNTASTANVIRWSTNFSAETKLDSSSILAIAIRYTDGPYFVKSEIIINGNHFLNQNEDYLLTTLTHELGHTIGLDHSDDISAVMAPSLQDPYYGLAQDDVLGMTEAYNQTDNRQLTKYVSPLAYSTDETAPISCGSTSYVQITNSYQGLFSVALGFLLGFIRKIYQSLKKLLKKRDISDQ